MAVFLPHPYPAAVSACWHLRMWASHALLSAKRAVVSCSGGLRASVRLCPMTFHTTPESKKEHNLLLSKKKQEFRSSPCFCLGWNEKLSRCFPFLEWGRSLLAGALAGEAGDTCTFTHLCKWFSHGLELGFPTSKTNALNSESLLQWLNFVLTFLDPWWILAWSDISCFDDSY